VVGLDNPIHLLFLLIILLLVFGAKRLPEMGRSLGAGLRGFKESISGETPRPTELTPAISQPTPTMANVGQPASTANVGQPEANLSQPHLAAAVGQTQEREAVSVQHRPAA